MKVEKNRFLLCSWLPTRTYHENVAIIWIYFSSRSGLFGHFFHEKSFAQVEIILYFSGKNLAKIRQ
jgi:hypothetical protein